MSRAFTVMRRAVVGWYDGMIQFAVLNLLWLLAGATIVLLPPATAAFYAVANEHAHGYSAGLSDFIEAGRRYFFKSWFWALLNVVVLTVTYANIVFYGSLGNDLGFILQSVFLAVGAYWLVIQFYFWPFMMEQQNKRVLLALRNATLTTLASPGFTFLMVVFVALLVTLSFLFVLPLGVLTVAVIALLGNFAVLDRLEAFGKTPLQEAAAASDAGAGPEAEPASDSGAPENRPEAQEGERDDTPGRD